MQIYCAGIYLILYTTDVRIYFNNLRRKRDHYWYLKNKLLCSYIIITELILYFMIIILIAFYSMNLLIHTRIMGIILCVWINLRAEAVNIIHKTVWYQPYVSRAYVELGSRSLYYIIINFLYIIWLNAKSEREPTTDNETRRRVADTRR